MSSEISPAPTTADVYGWRLVAVSVGDIAAFLSTAGHRSIVCHIAKSYIVEKFPTRLWQSGDVRYDSYCVHILAAFGLGVWIYLACPNLVASIDRSVRSVVTVLVAAVDVGTTNTTRSHHRSRLLRRSFGA